MNILKTIDEILENGLSSGEYDIPSSVRLRLKSYVKERQFDYDTYRHLDSVKDKSDTKPILIMSWGYNSVGFTTDKPHHHIVLEILVFLTSALIEEIENQRLISDDESSSESDFSDDEEDTIDEWI
jgi:hypothetical protein